MSELKNEFLILAFLLNRFKSAAVADDSPKMAFQAHFWALNRRLCALFLLKILP
jgi:hypothetical protein